MSLYCTLTTLVIVSVSFGRVVCYNQTHILSLSLTTFSDVVYSVCAVDVYLKWSSQELDYLVNSRNAGQLYPSLGLARYVVRPTCTSGHLLNRQCRQKVN